jgi:hypothetical protein
MTILCFVTRKKCLGILKGQSETVNRRQTDKIVIKEKMKIWQTIIYNPLQRKLKIEQNKPYNNRR